MTLCDYCFAPGAKHHCPIGDRVFSACELHQRDLQELYEYSLKRRLRLRRPVDTGRQARKTGT
jgi:hypothetical protein